MTALPPIPAGWSRSKIEQELERARVYQQRYSVSEPLTAAFYGKQVAQLEEALEGLRKRLGATH